MKTAGQSLLEDMRALGEAVEPLEELDLSKIWRGVRDVARNATASFKRGYARGSGKPMKATRLPDGTPADADAAPVKAKRLPDGTKADADAVPVAAKRLPDDTKADADAVPISGHEKPKPKAKPDAAKKPVAKPKAAEPPRAGKPDDSTAKPTPPAPSSKPGAGKQATCKPLKGRPGRFKCVSSNGTVYYKDSSGAVRRVK